MTACWCGNKKLHLFNDEYEECTDCGTLVSLVGFRPDQLQVVNDDSDFYGKQYWLDHQSSDLGFPSIYDRARSDLTERNLHWLGTLLKYRLPPAKVLEIGCSHGSFVALMRQAGYDASGVEMSPWVVEFGKKNFGVPITVGPIEVLNIEPGSLDVILLMDVLEHLQDPVGTMSICLNLLRPNGLLLIQTPQFKKGMDYQSLIQTKGAFLDVLKADEHLYLFSESSVFNLFRKLGAEHLYFEPAIFSHYDMFFVVSRAELQINIPEQVDSAMLSTSGGRLALAMLDLYEREKSLAKSLREADHDRQARGEQIQTLTSMVKESEADRAARGEQIETLTRLLKESEADRAVRTEQTAALTSELRALFARPVFHWISGFLSWPEVKKVAEWIRPRNE